jgi:8-oxo-dGTP diphosphatase
MPTNPSPVVPGPRPQLAVSAAIFRDAAQGRELLLVRRAHNPGQGRYSLPGGRVERGETLLEAVAREVMEETGLQIEIVALAGWRDAIARDADGSVATHFVVFPFAAHWRRGEVILNDEHDDYKWISPSRLREFNTTDGLGVLVESAAKIIAGS